MSIFQSSEVAEGLWAEWLSDTPMCQAVGQIPAGQPAHKVHLA
jgi:hypothetical protein